MKEVKTNNGIKGGFLKGKPHYDSEGNSIGGIKAVVTDQGGKPVELEGNEVIINKKSVQSKKELTVKGTPKQILSTINQLDGNGVAIGDEEAEILAKYKTGGNIGKMTKSELKKFYASPEGKKLDAETYSEWERLVNMTKSELQDFYNSKEGKKAGLSSHEAKELGIDSGRTSARWIMKMKDIPYTKWNDKMWMWAKKQISFIKRMSGMRGDLYDEKGTKTPKHTSLLIWGHNPERKFNLGGAIDSSILINGYVSVQQLYVSENLTEEICLITYNSGGQSNLNVNDTMNATEMLKLFVDELDILSKNEFMQIIYDHRFNSNRIDSPEELDYYKNGFKTIIVDRDRIEFTNVPKKLKLGGGVSNDNLGKIVYRGGKGLSKYFSTSKEVANDYANNRGGEVKEYLISNDAKIINYENIPNIKFKGINDWNVEHYYVGNDLKTFYDIDLENDYSKAEAWAKENNYDAVQYPTEGEIRVINENIIINNNEMDEFEIIKQFGLGGGIESKMEIPKYALIDDEEFEVIGVNYKLDLVRAKNFASGETIEMPIEKWIIESFELGTQAKFKANGREYVGMVAMKDGQKSISLYKDENYSGDAERIVPIREIDINTLKPTTKGEMFELGGGIGEEKGTYSIGQLLTGDEIHNVVSKYGSREDTDMLEFANDNISKNTNYIVKKIDIKDLIEKDVNLADYIKDTKNDYQKGKFVDFKKTPILLGDDDYGNKNIVKDGYGRIAQLYANGENEVYAFVPIADSEEIEETIVEKFKPYKTVDELSELHKVPVSEILDQLHIGEKVEMEHTNDYEIARIIALQHIEESPKYYTLLDKMEQSFELGGELKMNTGGEIEFKPITTPL